ncbi:MAG: Fis family transcriptional regulator [Ignavibacteriae bacterium]|nr:MAG: Fis family transcriptional regulator [Ignavibacteriota bacterium]
MNTTKSFEITHTNIILDSITDGVFTVDENMVITYFNKAAERITGLSKEEAIGQYCFEVMRSNICEKSCALKCSLQTGKDVVDKRVNILREDGREFYVSISTSPLKDENGKFIGGVETFRDLTSIEELKKQINKSYTFEDIISKNHQMLNIFDTLPIIAQSDSTVLIQGASGSGKELLARAVHSLSNRKKGPFVAVNCGALPDTLIESELFGYLKGAFTDARKDKPGRFALAKGGSIFLDEVESLPLSTQVKLLRVLQEKEFEPLGATAPVKADVRVIAATKENLVKLIKKGTFRDDLYYRLNVVKIELPLLVKKRDDIPILINHFIDKFNRRMGISIQDVSKDVMNILMQYDYPGNVRELENIIEHACVMCQGTRIRKAHLPPELNPKSEIVIADEETTRPAIQSFERQLILETLEKNNGNKVLSAKELGLHRSTLWRKMDKYGLT